MVKVSSRAKTGIISSAVCMIANIALAAAKIAAGLVFGLISLTVDGFNNLSDCGSGVVSLASFQVAEKPADKEHPYGHRRAEYVASMIIGFIILFLAAELLRGSVEKAVTGEMPSGNLAAYIISALSIAVKVGLGTYLLVVSRKLQSETLRAAAVDSFCDCAATAAVIVGLLIADYGSVPADGYVGILVALFILWQGIAVLKKAISELLGQAPDEKLVKGVRDFLTAGENVRGVHDLRVLNYGRGMYYATAHVEMDSRIPPLEAHSVLDGMEHGVYDKFGVNLTIHLDPVDLSDSEALELEKRVKEALASENVGLNVHDFRLVRGAKKKLVFDVAAPYSSKLTDAEIREKIKDILSLPDEYTLSVTVERE